MADIQKQCPVNTVFSLVCNYMATPIAHVLGNELGKTSCLIIG